MKIDHAALSDTGRVRENNEDACAGFVPGEESVLRKRGSLFIVADGMGGHRGGEIASGIAVRTIGDGYYQSTEDDPVRALVAAFETANASILDEATADESLEGMGTTCTAVVIQGGNAYLAHVGDSRAYLFRGGEIRQITHDHSLVGEMVRSGIITDEDARTHPKRHVITRSLGVQESIVADTPASPLPVEEGDTFVLCSDGLTAYADDADISRALEGAEPADACTTLVNLANTRGGRDNITVVVITVREV
jgi:serine/threonine protein phosphatase PrpC